MNHVESISLQYEKITWRIVDGNIQFTDEKLLKARIRLTNAQVDMQGLETERKNGKIIDTEFSICTLSRLAGEISPILDGLSLVINRTYPQVPDYQIERIRTKVARMWYRTASVGVRLPKLAAECIGTYQSEQTQSVN